MLNKGEYDLLCKSSKLDRYELVHKEKIQVSSNTTGIESGEAELYQMTSHEFRDTILCKTAFYNWLDCFGSKCSELRVDEDQKGLPKMEPFAQKLTRKKLDL